MTAPTPSASAGLAELVPLEADRRWISHLSRHLQFLADLVPADLFIFCPKADGQLVAVAEAKPTVRESFYRRPLLGHVLSTEATAVYRALETNETTEGPSGKVVNGQPMHQMAYPMKRGRHNCGVLVVERNLYEELKHTEEKRLLYRTAVDRSVRTLISKTQKIDAPLPLMAAGDATLLLGAPGIIRHASHQASVLARRFALPEALEGIAWQETFPSRAESHELASNGIYREFELTGRRQAICVRIMPVEPADDTLEAIVILRDITELREKDRELAIKETIIREVHHRVKNNLQTIAGLLRLQMRRTRSGEVKEILGDCIDRISSIALVHEVLAHDDVEMVDMQELAYNLLKASMQGLASPEIAINARVLAPKDRIVLPSAQATSAALVMNELLQNTCKHAFKGRRKGSVDLVLRPGENEIGIKVRDDGIGLPADFDPEGQGGLGWNIVRTLVSDDLRGHLKIESSHEGTTVTITIPTGS